MTVLILFALGLSGFLGWHYLAGGPVVGCEGGSPCEQVLSSRWATIGGLVPVSGLAAGAYLAMLAASFFIGPSTALPDRRLAWGAMLVLVGSAAGSAVWFTIVQKWIVGAFCPYCMAAHITGVLLAILVIWRALVQFDGESTSVTPPNPAPTAEPNVAAVAASAAPVQDAAPIAKRRVVGVLPAIGLALIGLSLAGAMAVSQSLFVPKGQYVAGETQDNNQPVFEPRSAPVVGSPAAAHIVTLFFDYKCLHCQRLHSMLDEAIARYDGKLAFVLCPAPLNSQCNPYIARDAEQFKDSCELVKVGLAVWVAKGEAFGEFDRWMFSPEGDHLWHPRTLDAAKAKAVELVGKEEFDAAWADPWIDRFVQGSVRFYGKTILGGNSLPKLVFGPRWVTPEPRDADDLVSILQTGLALPKP
jgi:uncharacterized membrane protein/protein-disulfide isomerase